MSRLSLSTEHWPIVVTTLSNGATDREYDLYFADFGSKVLQRRQKFTSLVDVSAVSEAPSAAQRKKIADWQKAEVEIGSRYNVGIAMIFTNRVVRGALTALHWLFPPPTVTVTFGTRLEAYDWCIERLEETGVPVPQSVRELAGRGGVVRSTGTV